MTSNDLLKTISKAGQQDIQATRLAQVTSVTDAGVFLKFYGETTASQKPYKRLSSYTPAIGDTVAVANINGSFLITGAVV